MRLLQVLPSVDPKLGGTAEGVRQLSLYLKSLGHTVVVVSLDAPSESFVSNYPLPVFALGPSLATYRYNSRLVTWLEANAASYDVVIVHGIWQYHSFAAWRALRKKRVPYFVFPHGMLDPWFKRRYPLKHVKKWMYWPWAEYRVLRDARSVLFTSEEERLVSRESFCLYKVKERVVAFGTNPPSADSALVKSKFAAAFPHLRDQRILLFLGRIHEKKGCELLVRAFAQLAPQHPSLHLVIAGPGQTNLVTKLKALARQYSADSRISWPGMLQGDMKWGAFCSAEAFVLPSHQENFGIAVVEAMSCGLPVLISDKVNIWREIEEDGAGFIAPDTLAGTLENLEAWLALDSQHAKQMSSNAVKSFQQRFTVSAMATSLLQILESRA